MNAHHATLEAAKYRVTSCDQDGFFTPDARIIGPDGFIYTFSDWHEEIKMNVKN
jgi:hypothetical protein